MRNVVVIVLALAAIPTCAALAKRHNYRACIWSQHRTLSASGPISCKAANRVARTAINAMPSIAGKPRVFFTIKAAGSRWDCQADNGDALIVSCHETWGTSRIKAIVYAAPIGP